LKYHSVLASLRPPLLKAFFLPPSFVSVRCPLCVRSVLSNNVFGRMEFHMCKIKSTCRTFLTHSALWLLVNTEYNNSRRRRKKSHFFLIMPSFCFCPFGSLCFPLKR
uniref:Uncharacterized protein n=1 Tax=Gasterosteus aculeatus aculeatus TaxID=481459 RepID=A0AAQ4NZ39_GASAC